MVDNRTNLNRKLKVVLNSIKKTVNETGSKYKNRTPKRVRISYNSLVADVFNIQRDSYTINKRLQSSNKELQINKNQQKMQRIIKK